MMDFVNGLLGTVGLSTNLLQNSKSSKIDIDQELDTKSSNIEKNDSETDGKWNLFSVMFSITLFYTFLFKIDKFYAIRDHITWYISDFIVNKDFNIFISGIYANTNKICIWKKYVKKWSLHTYRLYDIMLRKKLTHYIHETDVIYFTFSEFFKQSDAEENDIEDGIVLTSSLTNLTSGRHYHNWRRASRKRW